MIFSDNVNAVIRRVTPDGFIHTIAGTPLTFCDQGVDPTCGDGGLATNARLGDVFTIALHEASNTLYIADLGNNRIRKLNLGTLVIEPFAGVGGFEIGFGNAGDGGPATDAQLGFPEGIAVDALGNVYIADMLNCRIRRVDLTGTISHFAGGLGCGGSSAFEQPNRIAVDSRGNVYVTDLALTGSVVRRVDAITRAVTTVAGGGSAAPSFGDALTMDIGFPSAIAISASDDVYVGNVTQIFKIDVDLGLLSVYAGTGVRGDAGDGADATLARFNDIGGLAFGPLGELYVSDSENDRVRKIDPPASDDLVITLATTQALLDAVTAVAGSVLMINIDGRDLLVIPGLTTVGANVTVTGNDQLVIIDMHLLEAIGGNLRISGNTALTTLDLSSLTTIGGDATITDNPNLSVILMTGVTSIAGNLTAIGSAATVIEFPALASVGGDLNLNNNTSAATVSLGSLGSVGGGLSINDNTSAATVSLGSLGSVGGDLSVNGNTSAQTVSLGSLGTVGGDLSVADNGDATVSLGALRTVGGNLSVESTGEGTFDADVCAAGSTDIDATGYATVSAKTAGGGTTSVTSRDDSSITVKLAPKTFESCVGFTVTRVASAPEQGTDAEGNPRTSTPSTPMRSCSRPRRSTPLPSSRSTSSSRISIRRGRRRSSMRSRPGG